jgi:hypothetical protein
MWVDYPVLETQQAVLTFGVAAAAVVVIRTVLKVVLMAEELGVGSILPQVDFPVVVVGTQAVVQPDMFTWSTEK